MFFSNIVSSSEYGYFSWYLNNSNYLSTIYTSNHDNLFYQSDSGMVTVELAVGDTVSFKSLYESTVDHMSCYTLIKIK
jgi:hypothetical protein